MYGHMLFARWMDSDTGAMDAMLQGQVRVTSSGKLLIGLLRVKKNDFMLHNHMLLISILGFFAPEF